MRDDWRRQREEPPRAHALFEQYLALGSGRNLRTLARGSGASYSYLKKLSHLWRWRERAAGWQITLRQASQVEAADQVAEARKRQIRDAHTLLQLSRAQLARWITRDGEGTMRLLRRLTPHQAARFWQAGYRVERGLLPPITPERPMKVEDTLREARYQREREEETEKPRRRRWDLREEISSSSCCCAKRACLRGRCGSTTPGCCAGCGCQKRRAYHWKRSTRLTLNAA